MLFLLACTASPTDSTNADSVADTGPVYSLPDSPAPPEGAIEILSPAFRVEPYSEGFFCLVGSFPSDSEVVAVDYAAMYEDDIYGHHIQLNGIPDGALNDVADGDWFACHPDETMLMSRQVLSLNKTVPQGGQMNLPEGTAVQVKGGSRWFLEYHVVNPTDRPVDAVGVLHLRYTDPATVDTWASPWTHNETQWSIPSGERGTVEVDCTWEQDATVIALMGHMHEMAESLKVEMVTPDGTRSTIYDLPEWNPDWRYQPVIEDYEGGLSIPKGSRFITTCVFENTSDESLTFPEEMCVSTGLYTDSTDPFFCEPSRQ